MATNKSMGEALNRMHNLVSNMNKEMRELNAWNDILKLHITAQNHQKGGDWNDCYEYDPKTGKATRKHA